MNRLAMTEEIARRVPMLAQRDSDQWKRAEQLRKDFISDYPAQHIHRLELDEYVIGKGADNKSFCYRLERDMDILGRIVGSNAIKFGVYFGKRGTDKEKKYRFANHWGNTTAEAFVSIKHAIGNLLQAADKSDFVAIAKNRLSPMLKGKILFLYHPDQFAPIYAWAHLEHFVAELDLDGSFECEADMQRALMDYRAIWPELKDHPAALYMRFLYDVFGSPNEPTTAGSEAASIPMLNTAVAGAQFIDQMPPTPSTERNRSFGRGKTDYERRQRQSKRIGDRGERIVLALEKLRLNLAGKSELAGKIDYVAEREDGLGYDILSFDEDGTERPIEVKATTAPDLRSGFYITTTELETAGQLPNYHLYLVFSAMGKFPRVFPIKRPDLKGLGFELEPLNYLVTFSGRPLTPG